MLNQLIMVMDQKTNKKRSSAKKKKKGFNCAEEVRNWQRRTCEPWARTNLFGASSQWWRELHKDPPRSPQQPAEGASGRWYGFSKARLSRVLLPSLFWPQLHLQSCLGQRKLNEWGGGRGETRENIEKSLNVQTSFGSTSTSWGGVTLQLWIMHFWLNFFIFWCEHL